MRLVSLGMRLVSLGMRLVNYIRGTLINVTLAGYSKSFTIEITVLILTEKSIASRAPIIINFAKEIVILHV